VERVVLPDSTLLVHYCAVRLARLLANLDVDAERMRHNLSASHGLVFSQPVLLALVGSGISRDDAYRIVQRNALRSWEEGTDFRRLLEDDQEVSLDGAELDEAFDLKRSLRNVDAVFEALAAID
jgi:adenylosuccinate lyase